MGKTYRISRSVIKVLHKVRHRKGHGIHSPFLFAVITRVIEEKLPYYSYREIAHFLERNSISPHRERTFNRLVFRLINYFNAKQVLILGSGRGVTPIYATRVSKDLICQYIEHNTVCRDKMHSIYRLWDKKISYIDEISQIKQFKDCIIIDLDRFSVNLSFVREIIFPLCHEKSFVLIKNLRTNKINQLFWKEINKEEKVTLSVDLFHYGILFFDSKLHKKCYKLNY